MLSEEEFLLLWENCKSTNPDIPWDSYDPFTLINMDEAECKAEFPVEKNDLHRLAEAFQISGTLKCYMRCMRWNGGTMYAVETTIIPLSFQ